MLRLLSAMFVSSWRSSSIIFYQRSSSIKGHLPLKVIFHQSLSSIKGRLLSRVALHQGSSCIKGYRWLSLVFLDYCDLEDSRMFPWYLLSEPLQGNHQAWRQADIGRKSHIWGYKLALCINIYSTQEETIKLLKYFVCKHTHTVQTCLPMTKHSPVCALVHAQFFWFLGGWKLMPL